MKKYTVKKLTGIISGPGWLSSTKEEVVWAVVTVPYGISVKTFTTEAEAIAYCNQKNTQ